MDSHDAPESTPRQSAPSRLKDYFIGATPLQKRLESARKLTSFVPTPPRRKIPQCPQLQEDVEPQKVAFLLHKQWTLYSLTPLYKFSYTNLKEYSKLLSAFITAEKQKGLAVEVGKDFNIKVTFSAVLGMKGTQRDPEAFLVQILSKSQLPSENGEGKVLWSGWFCCVFGDSLLETVSEDFTCLPLFLAHGAAANTALIGTWFQKTFDCSFSPLAINAFNLSWMAAMWTACKMDQHFRIHLSATRLVRISTSVASAHTDGKIKILCHKYLIGVLAYLTELAIFQLE
ncbi:centromere protein L isoform X2 [Pteropus medius]|uniref:centromere protein L isoform X2 n=1 Tax=Pteropus vampyrus TaxID=132908 RepID=UPI00196B72F0|nr:centromere protein L isoform X2 [Pteropus giganteus]